MIYYIYSSKSIDFVDEHKAFLDDTVVHVDIEDMIAIDVDMASHLVVAGCVDEIKEVLSFADLNSLSVGIIATPKQKELKKTFGFPSGIEEMIKLAFTPTEKNIDTLYCDKRLVLQEVVVGDAPPLDKFDSTLDGKSYLDRLKIFVNTITKVQSLKHTQIKITDAKENELKFSAVGIVGVEYKNATFASRLVSKTMSANDGKLTIVILSPTSVMQYIWYLYSSLVSHISTLSLPKSVGYIQSSKIQIETKVPLKVTIDSSLAGETPLVLECREKSLALSVGDEFWANQSTSDTSKDSMKVDHLPKDEERTTYFSRAIPLFAHASKEQYSTLFTNLREEGKLSSTFMVLLILSTIIATLGLFINSSSVIIGAMLLAPLMQPIVSLSMGVLRQDATLQINGIKTISVGVLAVLLTSALVALLIPIEKMSSEMIGRLSPTILDLFVAIASGVAAAYAKNNEKIVGSLAGVSIAVALVPPIAVAGIGLGWADMSMFINAFLLFVTNLVGIVLAASLTFLLLGFSPLSLAKKGIFLWLAIVLIISIPLYNSFEKIKEEIAIQKVLSNLKFSIGDNNIEIHNISQERHSKAELIRCEVISSGVLDRDEKSLLKETILKSIDKKLDVIVTFRYRL